MADKMARSLHNLRSFAGSTAAECDSITLLRTFGALATKRITPAGIEGYGRAKYFRGRAVNFATLAELFRLLTRTARDPLTFVVRGEILDHVNRRRMLRRLHADRASGEPATLQDVPRHTVAIDWDGPAPPPGLDPVLDIEEVGDWLRGRLPEPFHDADAIVQLTSSAGLKSGVRARTWHVLNRPLPGADVKGWLQAERVEFDDVTLRPVETIYIATPIFEGRHDPVPRRWAHIPGLAHFVEVPDPLPVPPRAPIAAVRLGNGELPPAVGLAGYLALIGDGDGRAGFRQPIFSAVCSAARRLGPDGLEAAAGSLHERITKAVEAAPKRRNRGTDIDRYLSADHFAEIVEWAATRERGKRLALRQGRILATLLAGARP
jgi:hypothetical protein